MVADKSFRDLLAAFASSSPTPGGGSAAAAASALGTSLLLMVASLPKTRSGSDEDCAALSRAVEELRPLLQKLTAAIDADAAVYDQVVNAYRRPKGTEAELAAHNADVQRALRGATDVPLTVMRLSTLGLKQAEGIAAHGHRAAASDTGVAVELLRAGTRGARLNVETNLQGVDDRNYGGAVEAEADRLMRDAERSIATVAQSLDRR